MKKQDNPEISTLLELYKLYVQTAESTSDRRLRSNRFYLTFCSVLASSAYALFQLGKADGLFIFIASIFGVLFSFVWLCNIRSYKALNSGKFAVIHKLEQQLPFACFSEEWQELGRLGYNQRIKYRLLSNIESFVPMIFIAGFKLVILLYIYSYFWG